MKNCIYLLILLAFTGCKKDQTKSDTIACFDFIPDTLVKIGDTISFSNCSENATSFIWDFGDGSGSTEKFPIHIFKTSGEYNINLNAINDFSVDSISKYVQVIDKYYTDYHDTLLKPHSYRIPEYFYIDLDNDSIVDVTLKAYDEFTSSIGSFEYYIQIVTKNKFEILYSIINDMNYYSCNPNKPDTTYYYSVSMPKIINKGDVISLNDNFTNDAIMLVYNKVPHPMERNCSDGMHRNQWVGIGYNYIAFRQLNEKGYKIAWLKVKILSGTEIQICSSRYYDNRDEITVTD